MYLHLVLVEGDLGGGHGGLLENDGGLVVLVLVQTDVAGVNLTWCGQ